MSLGTATSPEAAEASLEDVALAVDTAIAAVSELDESAREVALNLQTAIEEFHKPALAQFVRVLKADPRGKELLFELVDDPWVRAVLSVHGIIKTDPMTRANAALAGVRPYLQSHGGDVELVRIENGAAVVRLQGACNGCSMSAVTLREGVEEALVQLDEVDRIEVLEDQPTTGFIAVDSVRRKSRPEPADTGWTKGPAVAAVADGSLLRFDVGADGPAGLAAGGGYNGAAGVGADGPAGRADGLGAGVARPGEGAASFVVTNIDNSLSVFRNSCAHQGLPIDGGMLDDGILTCPWHGFKFDASSGECVSAPGACLEQVATRIDDGHLWIRTQRD